MSSDNLFGWSFKKHLEKEDEQKKQLEFTTSIDEDGSVVVAAGGAYGQFIDLESAAKSEADLVTSYRQMTNHAEVTLAIDAICNEAIVNDQDNPIVKIVLDSIDDKELSKETKDKIYNEFDNILSLLNFSNFGYDIFQKWYVDGRLYYHSIINPEKPDEGIKELRYIDPRKIRKIREVDDERSKKDPRITIKKVKNEYYVYSEKGFSANTASIENSGDSVSGLKIPTDSIVQCTSGLLNETNSLVLGNLHTAIKPLNQLKMLEDAVVIYRVSRAPERRVFYIHVGNMPKAKAEQYVRDMMVRHKNKLVYNATDGKIDDSRRIMSMQEDYWLPRREDGKGTEITTLPGGQGLGEITDIEYFQKKLYKSLKVPISRLEPETGFSLGRASEITRDEVNFAKFIDRLRNRFSILFDEILKRQLILKNIISEKKWKEIVNKIRYDFSVDNHFSELKYSEILQNRIGILREMEEYVGVHFSKQWVRNHILYQNNEDIEKMQKEIEQEKEDEPDDEIDGDIGDGAA